MRPPSQGLNPLKILSSLPRPWLLLTTLLWGTACTDAAGPTVTARDLVGNWKMTLTYADSGFTCTFSAVDLSLFNNSVDTSVVLAGSWGGGTGSCAGRGVTESGLTLASWRIDSLNLRGQRFSFSAFVHHFTGRVEGATAAGTVYASYTDINVGPLDMRGTWTAQKQ
jgi:hypothetical protein